MDKLKKLPYCLMIIIILLYLFLPGLVIPGHADPLAPDQQTASSLTTVSAQVKRIIETYKAVGTVKPRSETSIQSQIRAQVRQVHVQAGDTVAKGDLLVTLDNRQSNARLDQAKEALKAARAGKKQAIQGVEAAKAAFIEAERNHNRIKEYFKSDAATQRELENAESGYLQAKAGLSRAEESRAEADSGIRQAEEVVREAEIALGFSRITAPATGGVIKRWIEPGDLALPGRPLISLRTESGFRIEAHIREGLIHQVKPGSRLKAEIPTLDVTVDAEVEEVIPYADPETRTFLVKAAVPFIEGLYPGMFGKLLIPESERDVVMIPARAVIRAGQLELVNVKNNDSWQMRYITTGKNHQSMVEVLSGLSGDETVGLKEEALP